jgi:5-methyltetrahydropteroyltriglutamate--homocysteine methyltransferase
MKIRGEDILLPVTNIGSWPRPTWMKGRIFGAVLESDFPSCEVQEKFEDCIRLCVQDQERLGFDVITDGNQYHESATPFDYEVTFSHIPSRIAGTAPYGPPVPIPGWDRCNLITVVDELKWVRPIFGPVMETVTRYTNKPRKLTLFSPAGQLSFLHDTFYNDPEKLAFALAGVYNTELKDLVARGLVDIVQFVDASQSYAAAPYIPEVVNSAIEGLSCDVWLHACHCQGSAGDRLYVDRTTEFLFPRIYECRVNQLHIALAHHLRRGDLEFFQKYEPPPDLNFGVGVVDVKDPTPEKVEEVVARIERVLQVLPAEKVTLMSDCGWMNCRRDTAWDKNTVLVRAAEIVRHRYQYSPYRKGRIVADASGWPAPGRATQERADPVISSSPR